MSADNWAMCPRCSVASIKRLSSVEGEYGKVTAAEYARMLADANKTIPTKTTLREDYEIGMCRDGVFSVSYGCSCDVCGFEKTFEHQEKVL